MRAARLAFVLTGASALIFETLSTRLLTLALGATADTAALALAAYMLGFTAGALAAARLASRVSPRAAAAVAQVALALFTLAVPALARLVGDVAAGAPPGAAMRAAAALLVVAPAAALMGALLPIVCAAMRPDAPVLASLYACSSAGGVLGVIAAQLVLAPALGLAATLRCGAALDALAALVLACTLPGAPRRGHAPGEAAPQAAREAAPQAAREVAVQAGSREEGAGALLGAPERGAIGGGLLAIAVASALLFALEVVWLHLFSALLGATAYAVGWLLVAVLVGLTLGAEQARGLGDGERLLPWLYVGVSGFLSLTVLLWPRAPALLFAWPRLAAGFAGREALRLGAALAMVAGPAALCGTAFPLALAALAGRHRDGARAVGLGSAASSGGAALGALAASALLIPGLGGERALRGLAALALGVAGLWARWTGYAYPGLLLTCALAVAPIALLPAWDADRLADGSALYFRRFEVGPVVWSGEDRVAGLVTVRGTAAARTLFINGKVQGDTGPLMQSQARMVGYALLGLQRFERALVIGVGTGYTTHLVAAAPFAAVDALEVSPAVLRAARGMFPDVNHGVLASPRVRVLLEDGRTFLAPAGPAYDLISVQVSSLWDAASSALYTREFYARAAARLAPGGVLQQWLPLHHLARRDLASVLATLQSELPYVTLWAHGPDGVALASASPQPLVEAALTRRDRDPRFAAFRRAAPWRELRSLVAELLLTPAGVSRFAQGAPILSEDTSPLEWTAARALADDSLTEAETLRWIEPYRTTEFREWRADQ